MTLNEIKAQFLSECRRQNIPNDQIYMCLLHMVARSEQWQHEVVGLDENTIANHRNDIFNGYKMENKK